MKYKIIKNPLVKHSLRRAFHAWLCEKYGCLTTSNASYYSGMPQSHCRRCGRVTSLADSRCAAWIKPFNEYE
jgi:hypothetical protein